MKIFDKTFDDKYSIKDIVVGIVIILCFLILMLYVGTRGIKDVHSEETVAMINDNMLSATIIDKDIVVDNVVGYVRHRRYLLFIDDAFAVDCTECGAKVEYTGDYLSVTEEIYNSYEIGDKIN